MVTFYRLFIPVVILLCLETLVLLILPRALGRPVPVLAEIEVVVLALLFLAVVGIMLRRGLRPLVRLREEMDARSVAAEPQRIGRSGTDEVARLATSYDALLDRLDRERLNGVRAVVDAQEDERRRVARDLHDVVGQHLAVVLLHLERMGVDASAAARSTETEAARDAVRAAMREVRAIGDHLRPGALDALGLRGALLDLAESTRRAGDLEVTCEVESIPELAEEVEIAVFRVVQESLTNVLRHSGAARVHIGARTGGGELRVHVVDDGRGTGGRTGRGMAGMAERAVIVGGIVRIDDAAGGGTAVTLTVPVVGAST